MQLNISTDYAIRIILYLASSKQVVSSSRLYGADCSEGVIYYSLFSASGGVHRRLPLAALHPITIKPCLRLAEIKYRYSRKYGLNIS